MRRLLLSSLRLLCVGLLLGTAGVPASSLAAGGVSIDAAYSPAANAFVILDCVANWLDGFCLDDGAYAREWTRRFGMTEEDRSFFRRYSEIRLRHYDDPDQAEKDPLKNRNGLFAFLGSLTAEPQAEAFYSSDRMDEAFGKLRRLMSREEIDFLRSFYARFERPLSLLLAESEPYRAKAAELRRSVREPRLQPFLARVAKFYGVRTEVRYRALFVWWPLKERTLATPTGRFLVLQGHPVEHASETWDDIVFHEIVHTISAQQDLGGKQAFTRAFLDRCDPRGKKVRRGRIIEEPLAVALGQMLFLKTFDPQRYERERARGRWYRDRWVNLFSQRIFPILESAIGEGRTLRDPSLIEQAARSCRELLDEYSAD